jgi:3-phenylpropionate/trans-cinnamate dioxygenase ferredoxin reductase component
MSISMARRVMNNGHIVIVGAGQAGARAAEALRAGGFAGAVTLVGEEAEPPYERPALSKGVLLGTDAVEATYCLPRAFYDEKQVDLRLATRVEAIAPAAQRILLSSGEWLPYDKLLLCTGSRVRPLPGAPDIVGVHYLRTIADCRKLAPALKPGGRLVVVGGGFIGLEVVSTAAKRGMSVAVVERQGNLLERAVPHGIAAAVERMHRARGVTIHLGTAAAEILGEERVIGVRLTDGTTIPADAVVVGIGIIPNTELAEAAGAASDDGLIVDERGRTTLANVYAAGDVTNHPNPILGRRLRLESWQNAQNQAIAVARSMIGADTPYGEVPWFWSDQFETNIQMVGAAAADATVHWRGDPDGGRAMAFAVENGRLRCAVAFNLGADIRFARKLIERGATLPPETLCDPGRKLRDIAGAAAA